MKALSQSLTNSLDIVAKQLVDAVDVGLICIDKQLNVKYANPYACMLLGQGLFEGTSLSGNPYFKHFGDLGFIGWLEDKAALPIEIQIRKEPARWMQVTKSTMPNQLIALRLVDISPTKLLELRLLGMVDSAEKETSLSSDFLASMTHELRTPLHAMISMGELLEDELTTSEQKSKQRLISSSGKHLLSLINNILDFSKAESGELELNDVPFDLDALVNETFETVKLMADKKGLQLSVSPALSLSYRLSGDDVRIKQILLNLIGNAIKFTSSGGVKVSYAIRSEDSDYAEIEFSITDTGIGIAPEALQRVFQRFSQADSGINRKFGGTGLGLSISRDLARQMDGDIRVSSVIDEGSTFVVSLLLKKEAFNKVDDASITTLEVAKEEDALAGMDILVVDDVAVNLLVGEQMLKKLGASVTTVDSGAGAIAYRQEKTYSAVLMDLQMPGTDGYEATKIIRAHEMANDIPRVPIIGFTANEDPAIVEECMAVGMQGCIPKPPSLARLRETLEAYK